MVLALATLLLLCATPVQLRVASQTVPESSRKQTVPSPVEQLDTLVRSTVKATTDPGVAVMVIKDGKVQYQ